MSPPCWLRRHDHLVVAGDDHVHVLGVVSSARLQPLLQGVDIVRLSIDPAIAFECKNDVRYRASVDDPPAMNRSAERSNGLRLQTRQPMALGQRIHRLRRKF
jgi:hypothetical protein